MMMVMNLTRIAVDRCHMPQILRSRWHRRLQRCQTPEPRSALHPAATLHPPRVPTPSELSKRNMSPQSMLQTTKQPVVNERAIRSHCRLQIDKNESRSSSDREPQPTVVPGKPLTRTHDASYAKDGGTRIGCAIQDAGPSGGKVLMVAAQPRSLEATEAQGAAHQCHRYHQAVTLTCMRYHQTQCARCVTKAGTTAFRSQQQMYTGRFRL